LPRTPHPNPSREHAIDRGRELVERYAQRSPELGGRPDERLSAAGDLIADVLTYITVLPDRTLPPLYRGDQLGRVSRLAARGVWNALAELLSDSTAGEDPDPYDIQLACEAFCDQMRVV
jgi:hypothetical protein